MVRFPRRVSLKALLLLTAAVAIVCAFEVQKWHYRKRVLHTIAQYRGVAQTNTVGPKWLREMVGDREAFEEVEGIYFGPGQSHFDESNRLTDAELVAALSPLSTDTWIEFLNLSYAAVTDRSADAIMRLRVARLGLDHTNVTDKAVHRIAEMISITNLDLDETNVTDDGLQSLADMPKLTVLKLQGTSVTDTGLDHLSQSTSLTTIIVRNTNVTREGVARLRESLPNCVVVSDF